LTVPPRGDVIARVPGLEAKAQQAKLALRNHLIEHKLYVARYGIDMPEIRKLQWRHEDIGY